MSETFGGKNIFGKKEKIKVKTFFHVPKKMKTLKKKNLTQAFIVHAPEGKLLYSNFRFKLYGLD